MSMTGWSQSLELNKVDNQHLRHHHTDLGRNHLNLNYLHAKMTQHYFLKFENVLDIQKKEKQQNLATRKRPSKAMIEHLWHRSDPATI